MYDELYFHEKMIDCSERDKLIFIKFAATPLSAYISSDCYLEMFSLHVDGKGEPYTM